MKADSIKEPVNCVGIYKSKVIKNYKGNWLIKN